jgi:hypothetical protein
LQDFQRQVSELLLRHRSLLDVMTKYSQSSGAVNRAVAKSITECGCIEMSARKQPFSPDTPLDEARLHVRNHLSGELCEQCRDAVTAELGKNLFYMSALCNLLDVGMDDVVERESVKCSTLGKFNFT